MTRTGRDPRAKKAKDNAKKTTRSNRIAESAARKIKRHNNQSIRRAAKVRIRDAEDISEAAESTPRAVRRSVLEVWSADSAFQRRQARMRERAFLDQTAGDGLKGRQRATRRRDEWDDG